MKKQTFAPKALTVATLLALFGSTNAIADKTSTLAVPVATPLANSDQQTTNTTPAAAPAERTSTSAPNGHDEIESQPAAATNPLRQSVVEGLAHSARLDASVHQLEALMDDANASFGDLLPTVDVRAQTGREHDYIKNGNGSTFNNHSYGIEARQNLFNGFASQARYIAAYSTAMQKYFQVIDLANQVAFDSATAHVNVSRYQALIKLAEGNLAYHQDLMDKIRSKVNNGVARQSDLDQAKSRYTLALSNLATEKANAFSAMAKYQQIVDKVWPISNMGEYVVHTNFEVDNPERLVFALNHHPLIRASNANIETAAEQIKSSSEGFYPRVDLLAKTDVYSNYLSTFDQRQISSIDLVASMNLFRGGSDKAKRSAAIRRKLQAQDDKLAICRMIRQTAQTALYDVTSSQRKENYFKEQADAITKARTAYEQQFSIGRRSLLDLLSAENEYYQAQRALINVEADLSVAKLKLLATTGQLIQLFNVEDQLNFSEPTKKRVWFYKQQVDSAADAGCPSRLINLDNFKLPNIGFDDAFKSVSADPAPLFDKPVEVAMADTGEQQASLADPAKVSSEIIKKTNLWIKAWESGNANRYIAFYSPTFKPEKGSYESWEKQRHQRLKESKDIQIDASGFQVIPSFDDPEVYEVSFVQNYKSTTYHEKSRKVLTWKQDNGQWKIIREQNLPVTAQIKAPNVSKTALKQTNA